MGLEEMLFSHAQLLELPEPEELEEQEEPEGLEELVV